MTFLQQSLLWGLLAASIPIIIHLLNKKRHRTVQWAAMEFLLKATRESRGKKKLKYILILACRTLAIVVLIFAIARPVMSRFLGWSGGKLETVVLILDRSTSMEQLSNNKQISKRESAITSIQKSLKELGSPRLILIDSASGKAQSIPSPDALSELNSTSATDTASSIPSLISTAIDYITDNSSGTTEIWVASDMQRSDWAPEKGQWDAIRAGISSLPQKTTLRILSLPSPPSKNSAIRVTSARRSDDELLLNIQLSHSESNGLHLTPITYDINGTRSSDKIKFNGQSFQFQKRLPLGNKKGEGHGFVSIPSDTNDRDNVFYFAYGEDLPTSTYIISKNKECAQWLSLTAAPPSLKKYTSIHLTPDHAQEINWKDASLVIWQAPLPEGALAQEFSNYLESGGSALMLPPEKTSKSSFLGLQWGKQSNSPPGQYFIVTDWDQTNGPLRNGLEGTPIPLPKLKAILRRDILGEATPLAHWDDEQTFLTRKVTGNGRAIFMTSIPDYTWSNLADADVLLPVVQRLISLGDTRFGSKYSARTGSKKTFASDGEIRTRLDSYSESNSSNAAYEAGVWQLGDRILASNRPVSEDQWQTVSENKLNILLEDLPYRLFEDKGQSTSLAQEAWRAFLIAMLVFLITEAILCLQKKPSK